ncbi:sugar transferase [Streptomyces sp. NBC_01537]|uniref:sugar transferase n=1 Tax=Streptomyces sp. NBC_01537 TaxID=2903896 RepID=UPI003866F09B
MRRHRGKVAWHLPMAVAVDAAVVALPAELVFGLANEPHAGACAASSALVWLLIGTSRGRYSSRNLGERDSVTSMLRDWLALVGVLAAFHAMTGESSDFTLALAALVPCVPMTAARQALLRRHLLALRRSGRAVRRVLVIGESSAVDGVVSHLARHCDHEYVVVGACTYGDGNHVSAAPIAARLDGQPPVRASRDSSLVLEAARKLDADLVFIVPGPSMAGDRLQRLSWAVHGDGRRLVVLPGITEVARRRLDVSSVAGLTLLHVAPPIRRGPALLLKSATDRLGAALLIVLLAPIFAVVAVAVRLDSAGTILHRQIRIAQGGRPFNMWKFRSMVGNAEQLRQGLAGDNEHDGRIFKIRRDPRVTRVGRVLRRYSLDELPQLINVLQGHMSLVGPRPPLPDEVAGYNDVEQRRLSVKPGLTGLWQVSGRSDLSWDETVALDLRYVDNWSPAGDLDVLIRTFRAVVSGNGAY